MNVIFRTPYSRDYEDISSFEVVLDDVSLTVPDDSYTIPQLFERAVAGYSLTTNDPVYNEDYDHPSEYGDYDLADYHTESLELSERFARREYAKSKLLRSVAKQSDSSFDGNTDVDKGKESGGEREGV